MDKIRNMFKKEGLTVNVQSTIFKDYVVLVKKEATKGVFTISSISSKVKNGMCSIVVNPIDESPSNMMQLGSILEGLKFKAASIKTKNEVEAVKKDSKNLIRLVFPKSVSDEFKELYGQRFFLDKRVGKKGDSMDFYFDVSDCINRTQLISRVLEIADAFNDILKGKRLIRDLYECDDISKYLSDNCGYMLMDKKEFEVISGLELIKQGYATLQDTNHSNRKGYQRLFNFIFGINKYDYFFFGAKVDENKLYTVKLRKPIKIEQTEIDYKNIIQHQYNYGEQISFGGGMKMVHNFQETIIDLHNNNIKSN